MDERVSYAVELIKDAGKLIIDGTKGLKISPQDKEDTSFVTEWDKKTEHFVIEKLTEVFPGDGFIGEEGDDVTSTTGYKWVIDPIDGTTNFSKGQPFWAISIGLVYKDEVVGGVIYAPVFDKLYFTSKGMGIMNDNILLSVSNKISLNKSLITLEIPSRPYLKETTLKLFPLIENHISRIRMLGMAAYNLTQIAAGEFDLYLSIGQKSWDTAAGVLMVREAGGIALDIEGNEWNLDSESLVAGNEVLVRQLVNLIRNEM